MGERKWQEILSDLTRASEKNLLKIGKRDLVRFCLENKELRNSVDGYLKSIRVTKKDSAVALQKKEEGNKSLLENKFEESLESYTKSIFCANKNDEVLPLAYANRSLVLEKLGHLTESIADIEMALTTGYPKDRSKKLRLRKAKCLSELKIETEHKAEYQLPKLADGESKDFASASASLSVYFNKNKGRHVIAKKDIELGAILFVEKAFAFVVCEEACANCLKSTVAPIPCENCLDVTYCSLKCREDSCKAGHSFLCGFGELFNSVGIAHLGLQIVIAASSSLDELKNKLNGISEPEFKNGPVLFKSTGYDTVYKLVHHSDDFEVNDLFQYTLTALLLATYMKNHTNYFPTESGDEDLKLLTSVILRHILQMICNGHAIMGAFVKDCKNYMVLSKAEQRIATGIYPSVSMMNHACQPSVIISFYKSYAVVQAAMKIKKGEEVFNCYGADARRMERAHRQEILSKQYFFKCECQICLKPIDIYDKFTAFKCKACNGPSIQNLKSVLEATCIDCGLKSEIPVQLILKVDYFYSLLNKGRLLMDFDVNSSLKVSLKAWQLGREIFYKFHKDVSCAADMVAMCFAILKDFKRCISFLKSSILSVEERFGSCSLELLQEMNKLLDVQIAHLNSLKEMPSSDDILEHESLILKAQRLIQILDGNPQVSFFQKFTKENKIEITN